MRVKEIMKQPYVVDKDVTLKEAASVMSKKGIGSLIFVSKKKVKGIITERDLLRNFDRDSNISKVMTEKVFTVSPEDNIEEALEVMKDKKVKRLPVVEKGELIGVISLTDIAAHVEEIGEGFFFD